MEGLVYAADRTVSPEQMADCFRQAGLRRPVDNLPRMARMLEHADELLTVWDGERLVGLLRAVTDYSYCCYISDLAVHSDYQRRGVGKRLIELLQDRLGTEEVQYVLTSAPGAVAFYEHIGFLRADKAFFHPRQRNT